MKNHLPPIRKKIHHKLLKPSDTPIIIYLVVLIGMLVTIGIKNYHEDLSLNLLSELIGAAFTLFVIDVLLVKSKTKRWRVVQKHIDYLIARTINRLRDGISTRVFSFEPTVKPNSPEEEVLGEIRDQRENLFIALQALDSKELSNKINRELFKEESYQYFNEKADDIWDLLNMKYSEYLAPVLVSLLIELHTNIKDVCSHIRFYKKSDRFPKEKEYYQMAGIHGAANSMKEIIRIVNKLKEEGYSETARTLKH